MIKCLNLYFCIEDRSLKNMLWSSSFIVLSFISFKIKKTFLIFLWKFHVHLKLYPLGKSPDNWSHSSHMQTMLIHLPRKMTQFPSINMSKFKISKCYAILSLLNLAMALLCSKTYKTTEQIIGPIPSIYPIYNGGTGTR